MPQCDLHFRKVLRSTEARYTTRWNGREDGQDSHQGGTILHCGTITIAKLVDDYHCEILLRQPTVKSRNNAMQRRDAHLDAKHDCQCVKVS